MSEQVGRMSPEGTAAVSSHNISEVFKTIMDITHAELAQSLHLINNNRNITSNGKEYVAMPFSVNLPDETPDGPPQTDLEISNIPDEDGDTPISDAIETLAESPLFTLSVISTARPDVIEFGPISMELSESSYDRLSVQGTLVLEAHMQREPHPYKSMDPSNCPGLFRKYGGV